ncbi:SusE domain-containing protein [Mucilaginibacter sp. ZT4R22]|uniref:SusE domain-containing protein n=1 Tax=Mucilaginibacter pankratovii TaxID=2772110 RepID=A0ABR7WUU8_9SPHI|nr:SusE domain-containing protein [Mucilaginibacter pankratovii]MBD1366072.1 SusE domain-containing protein [Mucilaginibacter pankratovii]
MKKIFYSLLACVLAVMVIPGCKKDKTLNHTNVSAVSTLFAPENNKFVKIASGASGAVSFEWEQAHAEDNGLVLYEVAFDKEGGDFSHPLYSAPSDGNGLYNKLSLSFSDLNKIATSAGVKPQESGKVIWTVMSSKGINVQKSTQIRTVEIQRPAGFTDIPTELYLTGTATEGGEDLSKAIKLKLTAPGKFEAFTSLKAGTYHFADRNTGTPSTYSYDGTKLTEEGNTTVTGATKVQRIELDFNVASFKTTEVVSVGLWFAADNKIWFDLPYKAAGVWEIDGASIVFHQESWGRDERYKFRFTFKDAAGATTTQYYGSTNSDNNRPDAGTAPSYFYMVPVNNSQYDYSFKFTGAADNKTADIKVDFSGASGAYTHSVKVN